MEKKNKGKMSLNLLKKNPNARMHLCISDKIH